MSQIRKLKTGHTVEPINEKDVERLKKNFTKIDGLVRLQPGGWFLFDTLPRVLDKIYDFGVSVYADCVT